MSRRVHGQHAVEHLSDDGEDKAKVARPINDELVREPVEAPVTVQDGDLPVRVDDGSGLGVRVSDFAFNRGGTGWRTRCAPPPNGCGQVLPAGAKHCPNCVR